jgi:hypothetical protein
MIGWIVLSIIIALICAAIASARGHDRKEGFVLGLILGPFAPMAMRDHENDAEAKGYAESRRAAPTKP